MFEKKILEGFKGNYAIFKNVDTGELFVQNQRTNKILKPYIRGWSQKQSVSVSKVKSTKKETYALVELWDMLN